MAERFRLDEASVEQADDLVRQAYSSFGESLSRESAVYEVAYEQPAYAQPDQASDSLRAFAWEERIPFDDVVADLDEFASLSRLALSGDGFVPCLRVGEATVPLLPGRGPEKRFGSDLAFLDFMASRELMIPVATARDFFFLGLRSFLAHRISGTRWQRRSHHENEKASASIGAPPPPADGEPGAGSGGHYQKWSVACVGSGLSIYSAGTHAARYPADYLGAPTTPVDIYLPMGTYYLGADAGLNGDIVWDDKGVVRVPSMNPHFKTIAF